MDTRKHSFSLQLDGMSITSTKKGYKWCKPEIFFRQDSTHIYVVTILTIYSSCCYSSFWSTKTIVRSSRRSHEKGPNKNKFSERMENVCPQLLLLNGVVSRFHNAAPTFYRHFHEISLSFLVPLWNFSHLRPTLLDFVGESQSTF